MLKSIDAWTAAIHQHKSTWEGGEAQKYKTISTRDPSLVLQKIDNLLGSYSVLRTLSKSDTVRRILFKKLFATSIDEQLPYNRYSIFASYIQRIATEIGKQQDHGRPFSLISKLMIHLYPQDGFIFDKNACNVMRKITGRGYPHDTALRFERFVRDYWTVFGGLRTEMRKDYRGVYPSLPHTIDKFLWIQGGGKARQMTNENLKEASPHDRREGKRIADWFATND